MGELLVCVSLAPFSSAQAQEQLSEAKAAGADMAEIRLDLMPEFDLKAILNDRPLPIMLTYRPKEAGGEYQGGVEERLTVLREAIELGVEYVDIEPELASSLDKRKTKIVVSHHDFTSTPSDLNALHTSLAHSGADIVKIAVTAQRIEDNLKLFRLLESSAMPTIALAMGEAGVISRLLAGRYDAFLTFASLNAGKEVASGQVPLADMLNLYRVKKVKRDTALYGVMANPVGHSMSPHIHNAAFQACGLDAIYLPLLVQEPVSFLKNFTPLGFQGYSVTIPHKQAIIPALDEVEPLARRIGAVNTVVVHDGKLLGYNTDVDGAILSIEEAAPGNIVVEGASALIIGAGGLGRALVYALTDRGLRVTVANRTLERARELATATGASYCSLDEIAGLEPDILLQTTSVGMHPKVGVSVVPQEMLRPGLVVYDAVYNPLETRLLQEAKEAGCITVSGLGHFINQAARQFELWTGIKAPTAVMKKVMLERLGH